MKIRVLKRFPRVVGEGTEILYSPPSQISTSGFTSLNQFFVTVFFRNTLNTSFSRFFFRSRCCRCLRFLTLRLWGKLPGSIHQQAFRRVQGECQNLTMFSGLLRVLCPVLCREHNKMRMLQLRCIGTSSRTVLLASGNFFFRTQISQPLIMRRLPRQLYFTRFEGHTKYQRVAFVTGFSCSVASIGR
jgi:hypothetical protein